MIHSDPRIRQEQRTTGAMLDIYCRNYGDSLLNIVITGCVQRPSAFSEFSKL